MDEKAKETARLTVYVEDHSFVKSEAAKMRLPIPEFFRYMTTLYRGVGKIEEREGNK